MGRRGGQLVAKPGAALAFSLSSGTDSTKRLEISYRSPTVRRPLAAPTWHCDELHGNDNRGDCRSDRCDREAGWLAGNRPGARNVDKTPLCGLAWFDSEPRSLLRRATGR